MQSVSKLYKTICMNALMIVVLLSVIIFIMPGRAVGEQCIGIGYGHLDVCWRWSTALGIEKMRSASEQQIINMNNYSTFNFSQDGAVMHEWMEKYYPSVFDDIKAKMAAGQWEALADWSDALQDFIEGEAAVRNISVAKRYYYDNMDGYISEIRGHPDNFSSFVTGNYPQILLKSGIKMQWFVRSENDAFKANGSPLWWVGNDGSRMPSYRTPEWFNCPAGTCGCGISSVGETAVTYGTGDGGGGPNDLMLNNGCNNTGCDYFGTFEDLYNSVNWGAALPEWGDVNGDGAGTNRMVTNDLNGVYCYRPFLKERHRKGVNELLIAEKFGAFARKYGYAYSNDYLVEAWKPLLYWEHHDSLGGNYTWEGTPEASADLNFARDCAATFTSTACAVIENNIDTEGTGVTVAVYNALSWDRTEVVEVLFSDLGISEANNVDVRDSLGNIVPSQVVIDAVLDNSAKKVVFLARDIPSMGFEAFKVIDIGGSAPTSFPLTSLVELSGTTMGNDDVEVTVESSDRGRWSSVIDKSDGNRETISGNGNYFGTTTPPIDGNYGRDWTPGFSEMGNADSITVIENGPVRGKIRVTRSYQGGTLYQDTIVCPYQHRINGHMHSVDLQTVPVFDGDMGNYHVSMRFSLATTDTDHTSEAMYGYCVQDNAAGHSPCINWVDISDGNRGASVITDSKYGYDTTDSQITIDLISKPDFPEQHCYYCYYPHTGDWRDAKTTKIGYEINTPFIVRVIGESHAGSMGLSKKKSFMEVTNDNIIVSVVKKHEDSDDTIIRFFEYTGQGGTANITLNDVGVIANAYVIDMIEWTTEGGSLNVVDTTIQVPFAAYEIVTIKAETYPYDVPTKVVCEASSDLYADGVSVSMITASIVDDNEITVFTATNQVQFVEISGMASLASTAIVDAIDGIATVLLQAGGSVGTATVQAWPSGLTEDSIDVPVLIAQVVDHVEIEANPTMLREDGTSTSLITASIIDQYDNVFAGATNQVEFSLSGEGALLGATIGAAQAGMATVILQSSMTTGTATVTATASGVGSDSVDVEIVDSLWIYKRKITVDNDTGGSLTDYTINILLSPSDFDYSHARADGYDIRFALDDGTWYDDQTPISYYCETWFYNGYSSFWIEIPNVPIGTSEIFMYYGNPESDTTASDVAGTFLFADDFESGSLAANGWVERDPVDANWSIISDPGAPQGDNVCRGIMAASGDGGIITGQDSIVGYEAMLKMRLVSADDKANVQAGLVLNWGDNDNYYLAKIVDSGASEAYEFVERNGGSNTVRDDYARDNLFNPETWWDIRARVYQEGGDLRLRGYFFNNKEQTTILDTSPPAMTGKVGLWLSNTSGTECRFDSFLVRKYSDPDPGVEMGIEKVINMDYGDPDKIVSTASPLSIVADGNSTALITSIIADMDDIQVATATNLVVFSVSGEGTLLDTTEKSASAGLATVIMQATLISGTPTVISISSGLSQGEADIETTPFPSKLINTASPVSITADGAATSMITAGVSYGDDTLVATAVNLITFSMSGQGALLGTTKGNASGGVLTILLQSGTNTGTTTVISSSSGLSNGNVSVAFEAGDAAKLVNTANPQNIFADGISVSTITAQAFDAFDNIVTTLSGSGWSGFSNGSGAWQYRKPLTITSSAALTDYQLEVNFTDVDAAGLVSGGKMQADYADARFTLDDESTEIGSYIDLDGSSFWLKVPGIANGTTMLYMYYGNPAATAVSDGSAVFDFFDDFAILDTGTWTELNTNGAYSIVNNTELRLRTLALGFNEERMVADWTPTSNSIIETKMKSAAIYRGGIELLNSSDTTINVSTKGSELAIHNTLSTDGFWFDGTRSGSPALDTWYKAEYIVNGTASNGAFYDMGGSQLYSQACALGTTGLASIAKVRIGAWNDDVTDPVISDYYYDWIRIRKYTGTEPTASAAAEEESEAVNITFSLIFI